METNEEASVERTKSPRVRTMNIGRRSAARPREEIQIRSKSRRVRKLTSELCQSLQLTPGHTRVTDVRLYSQSRVLVHGTTDRTGLRRPELLTGPHHGPVRAACGVRAPPPPHEPPIPALRPGPNAVGSAPLVPCRVRSGPHAHRGADSRAARCSRRKHEMLSPQNALAGGYHRVPEAHATCLSAARGGDGPRPGDRGRAATNIPGHSVGEKEWG